ncbi:MAG: hypothetical protein HOM14_06720 [Gammaproteobacteria bacterium]|nr:hypothetical protein [Gammaproteobacteria bacterium]MBT4087583.1 hypothetical protein [Deltaproteobacteria bacterium]MBT3725407.1 hypothetical protein [Gammaproteobacteria bacterium]MBT4193978.1 hypothetical protein [Gammaproteobacteria bacterium]MBT4448355.1 hypothetical protein [Gammaproteobacteria bacterium]
MAEISNCNNDQPVTKHQVITQTNRSYGIDSINSDTNNLSAAMTWYGFGLNIAPISPGTKKTARRWDSWLENFSMETVVNHWKKNPDHEVGFIVGDDIIVFDADSPESIARLYEIEKALDVHPSLTIKTEKGEHHYFKRDEDSVAKSDSHSTEQHPERIDVKTGRALIVLPPSGGKEVWINEADHCRELAVAPQAFIDAVARNNGRDKPQKPKLKPPAPAIKPEDMDQQHRQLDALLTHIGPDCGYEDWLHALMAVHYETGGAEEGLAIVDDWSSQGKKYPGSAEIEAKWRSFDQYDGTSITVATLHKMVEDNGYNWIDILSKLGPQFKKCKFVVIHPDGIEKNDLKSVSANALETFSLTGKSPELEAQSLAEVHVLDGIALLGQWTTLFSKPNVGKTVFALYFLIDAIQQGRILAKDVFYLDLDDNHAGLTTKTKIAEEVGFHIICDGYEGFKVSNFIHLIEELISKDQVHGIILVLDTLKKFTSLMDKSAISRWNQIMRRFVVKGGTIIALAHTNKKSGSDGKPIPAGVSDLVDDVDCAYTIDVVEIDQATQAKTIVFENIKRRGNVVNSAAYSYSVEDGLSYEQLLASVQLVDQSQLEQAEQAESIKTVAEIIDAIMTSIVEGVTTKMAIRDSASERTSVSKRRVLEVIETYTGSDTDHHRWNYSVQNHGRHVYHLLN